MTTVHEAYDYIPETLWTKIPPLYTTDGTSDPTVWIKLFTPDSSWTWYLTEVSALTKDGQHRPINGADHIVFAGDTEVVTDIVCFGLVVGHEMELGYFSLTEIRRARGALGAGRGARVARPRRRRSAAGGGGARGQRSLRARASRLRPLPAPVAGLRRDEPRRREDRR